MEPGRVERVRICEVCMQSGRYVSYMTECMYTTGDSRPHAHRLLDSIERVV